MAGFAGFSWAGFSGELHFQKASFSVPKSSGVIDEEFFVFRSFFQAIHAANRVVAPDIHCFVSVGLFGAGRFFRRGACGISYQGASVHLRGQLAVAVLCGAHWR